MAKENRITKVELSLYGDTWTVAVTKEFAPEYGGGSTIFTQACGTSIHGALDYARSCVTMTPAHNPNPYLGFRPKDEAIIDAMERGAFDNHEWDLKKPSK